MDKKRKDEDGALDSELEPLDEKLPYPKSVFFIVSNEFCERFSFYGMRTVLTLYLVDILMFSETDAKIIFHTFIMFVYFFPIFGAMLADSFLGKFYTILYVSIVYAIGNIVLALSATPPLNFPAVEFSMVGLLLIALGTGGIKPCVAAFGGDQFRLPQQEMQLAKFFSMFYFSINAGSLISTAVTPILREDVKCFDDDSCYSLAFGVPGILMIISIVIFFLGKPLYIIRNPEGNVVIRVSKCIGNAIKMKLKNKGPKKEHWLDNADEKKFDRKLVNDIKAALKVLFLYLPLPVFWALFDQQGSGWTLMARRMDGDIGFYTILPDQMQVVNPLLILAFIPMFQYAIYPLLDKLHLLQTPLKRLVAGGVLAAVSFAISASISLQLESGYPTLPSAGNGQLRIYNNQQCNIKFTFEGSANNVAVIQPMNFYEKIDIPVTGNKTIDYSYEGSCANGKGTLDIIELQSAGYFFTEGHLTYFEDSNKKEDKGLPRVRTLINDQGHDISAVEVTYTDDSHEVHVFAAPNITSKFDIKPGKYKIQIGETAVEEKLRLGGVYVTLAIAESATKFNVAVLEVTPPNNVHMLWLIPQYVIITMGEIMYSITGLEFAYSQAPVSMKSLLQACWLLTTAFGNLLVIIIEAANTIEEESTNFFIYAGIMLADMLVFSLMAMRYKYVENVENGNEVDLVPTDKEKGVDNSGFEKEKGDS